MNETKKSDRNEIIAHALEQRMQTVYGLADRVATLSTGVLAFTITFAKNSVSPAASHQPLSLKLSWFGFMLSVVGFFIIHVGKSSLEARALAAVRSGVSGAITVVPPWYFHFGRWLVTVGFLGGLLCLTIYGFYYA